MTRIRQNKNRMMMRHFPCLVLFAALAVSSSTLSAQTVTVDTFNGRQLAGPLLEIDRDGIALTAGELGRQRLPWSLVRAVRSNGAARLGYGDGEQLVGAIVGREGSELLVLSGVLGPVRLPLADLNQPKAEVEEKKAAEAVPTPLTPGPWTGKVALGVTATGGNSDTFTGSLEAFIERNFSHDRIEGALRVVYGTSDGEENANNQLIRGKWEHYYSDRFYSFFGTEFGRDKIQEVSARLFTNIGAGYTVWKESDNEFLKLEGGLGYRHESFSSDTASRDDITARAAVIYDDVFFDNLDFHQLGEVVVPLTDPASWIARSETVLSMPISESWSFRNSIILTYQGDPAEDAKSLDWLITAGLEYGF